MTHGQVNQSWSRRAPAPDVGGPQRGIATRYEKTSDSCRAAVTLASLSRRA
ncbi:hypothetical protein [Streptomyces lydicus]|uniref:hypothetical protein n=1 Tax=Streptomyces lydicus TaxID=47763 RepID=UPI0034200523